jgi:hypothetical protein
MHRLMGAETQRRPAFEIKVVRIVSELGTVNSQIFDMR